MTNAIALQNNHRVFLLYTADKNHKAMHYVATNDTHAILLLPPTSDFRGCPNPHRCPNDDDWIPASNCNAIFLSLSPSDQEWFAPGFHRPRVILRRSTWLPIWFFE